MNCVKIIRSELPPTDTSVVWENKGMFYSYGNKGWTLVLLITSEALNDIASISTMDGGNADTVYIA